MISINCKMTDCFISPSSSSVHSSDPCKADQKLFFSPGSPMPIASPGSPIPACSPGSPMVACSPGSPTVACSPGSPIVASSRPLPPYIRQPGKPCQPPPLEALGIQGPWGDKRKVRVRSKRSNKASRWRRVSNGMLAWFSPFQSVMAGCIGSLFSLTQSVGGKIDHNGQLAL